jgi:hypothetical protein
MRTILAAAVFLAMAGCASADGGKVTISHAVADDFKSYQQAIGAVGSGVYAITEDGQGGASAGCRSADCMAPGTARQKALDKCERLNPGRHCIVFAKNLEPVIEFEVQP